MKQEDPKAVELLQMFGQMKTLRASYENNWQQIKDYVRPGGGNFQRQSAPGSAQSDDIYDSTAVKACATFASALHGYLVNPHDRWFTLAVRGVSDEDLDDESLAWLEDVSDRIFSQYQVAESNHTITFHENFLDLGAFGNGCIYQDWDYEGKHLLFKQFSLSEVFVKLNYKGRVDTVARQCNYTMRQILQEFGDKLPPGLQDERIQNKSGDREYSVIHLVLPRSPQNPGLGVATSKAFASFWLCEDTKEVIKESGYDSLPYHFGRWTVMPREVYGRGPAIDMLPDIRMLNKFEYVMIKAGMKAVDPPLQVPDDGFTTPIDTGPGAIIWHDPMVERIEALVHEGNLPFGLEQANQKRQSIMEGFYADWIHMEKENVEMTAFEVQDRRDEKFRLMTPLLGRVASEQLGPSISRSYALLDEHGVIPPAPESLRKLGASLRIVYIGPAAKAQEGVKTMNLSRFMQDVAPVAQVDPSALDVVNMDEVVKEAARGRSVTRKVIRSPQEIQAIREKRAQAQVAQQAMAAVEPLSKAVKNAADAGRSA
jgi:hypothetical protein